MSILQTAERVSHQDKTDNYVFQRSLLAYVETAKMVSGRVLELGTGSGYGVEIIAPEVAYFLTIDKYAASSNLNKFKNVEFRRMTIPPLKGIESNSFDYVITFQVIEHIKDDKAFVEEIHRVLKPGGKMIVTTPNKDMSITRNPWHIREYKIQELKELLLGCFEHVEANGVFGNEKIMEYYESNKASVKKITRFDVLDLQHRLPRQLLQLPYDILNRLNRRKLYSSNSSLVEDIEMKDYYVQTADKGCFDLFYIAQKGAE